MSQTQAINCITGFSAHPAAASRRARSPAEPGVIARRLLPLLTAGALIAAAVSVPRGATPALSFSPVIVRDAQITAVRDKAEAMRAALLRRRDVAAVTIAGLNQQGLSVDYTQHRLATFGLTPASLAAAVPTDLSQSRPGHLVLRPAAAGDLQSVADIRLRAHGLTFRLGDVAMVVRAPLAAPVSTMTVEGQPAAQLDIVPAR